MAVKSWKDKVAVSIMLDHFYGSGSYVSTRRFSFSFFTVFVSLASMKPSTTTRLFKAANSALKDPSSPGC